MADIEPLSITRLFKDSTLRPPLPLQANFSPDGRLITFLSPGPTFSALTPDEPDCTDAGEIARDAAPDPAGELVLHRFDTATGITQRAIRAADLYRALKEGSSTVTDEQETRAERAERERRRQFATGIVSYQWYPAQQRLLIPLAGAAFEVCAVSGEIRRLTAVDTRQTDFQLSPAATWLSYVRDGDLYVSSIATLEQRRITDDGDDLRSNGIADFIAQEEMHRFKGHWWSPDEQILVYQKTDSGNVQESYRHEFGSHGLQVIPQRYPFAGTDNAKIQLIWHEVATGVSHPLPWQAADDEYLARVDWLGNRLFIQTQSRNQQCLRLKYFDVQTQEFTGALQEQADTWINLDDNFTPVNDNAFYWTAERGGTRQIYRIEQESDQFKQQTMTAANTHVSRIVRLQGENLWYTGWHQTPTEQHLFCLNTVTGDSVQITQQAGWHEIELCPHTGNILDRWSTLARPQALDLLDSAGNRMHHLAGGAIDAQHPYRDRLSQHQNPVLGSLTAEDGQILHYRLTKPIGAGPFPVVVQVYGGPGVQRVRQEWAGLELQLFVSRGIGVLELDNRGSSNRGAGFEAPIYRLLGNVEVADQVVGAKFLATLPWVDASRIGVVGHSYGGYMALICLAKRPDIFAAGVSIAPVTDWKWYDTHYTERYLGTPQDNPEGYHNSSVFPHIQGLQRPLLIMHGMADDNVLFNHSTALFLALQQQDIGFSMMTYPGSKHALQEPHVAIHRYRCLLDFFEKHLRVQSGCDSER